VYSKIPGNEKIRKTNETGPLPRRPGIYRLAANGMMDCRATAGFAQTSEQENDYAGGNKAINPRVLGARSRHMIEKYLYNDATV